MRCPQCDYVNLSGAEQCADCGSDLTVFDQPQGRDRIEKSLLERKVRELNPRNPILIQSGATVGDCIAKLKQEKI